MPLSHSILSWALTGIARGWEPCATRLLWVPCALLDRWDWSRAVWRALRILGQLWKGALHDHSRHLVGIQCLLLPRHRRGCPGNPSERRRVKKEKRVNQKRRSLRWGLVPRVTLLNRRLSLSFHQGISSLSEPPKKEDEENSIQNITGARRNQRREKTVTEQELEEAVSTLVCIGSWRIQTSKFIDACHPVFWTSVPRWSLEAPLLEGDDDSCRRRGEGGRRSRNTLLLTRQRELGQPGACERPNPGGASSGLYRGRPRHLGGASGNAGGNGQRRRTLCRGQELRMLRRALHKRAFLYVQPAKGSSSFLHDFRLSGRDQWVAHYSSDLARPRRFPQALHDSCNNSTSEQVVERRHSSWGSRQYADSWRHAWSRRRFRCGSCRAPRSFEECQRPQGEEGSKRCRRTRWETTSWGGRQIGRGESRQGQCSTSHTSRAFRCRSEEEIEGETCRRQGQDGFCGPWPCCLEETDHPGWNLCRPAIPPLVLEDQIAAEMEDHHRGEGAEKKPEKRAEGPGEKGRAEKKAKKDRRDAVKKAEPAAIKDIPTSNLQDQLALRAATVAQERQKKRQIEKKKEDKDPSKELLRILTKSLGKKKKEKKTGKKKRKKKRGSGGGDPGGGPSSSSGSGKTTSSLGGSSKGSSSDNESSSEETKLEPPLKRKSKEKPGSVLQLLVQHARDQLDQTAKVSVLEKTADPTNIWDIHATLGVTIAGWDAVSSCFFAAPLFWIRLFFAKACRGCYLEGWSLQLCLAFSAANVGKEWEESKSHRKNWSGAGAILYGGFLKGDPHSHGFPY